MGEVGVSALPRPPGVIEVDWVLDIGPGIRPMGWYKPLHHMCVEPYGPYADRLQAAGYATMRMSALSALTTVLSGAYNGIYLLDVIEHMERPEGEAVIRAALALQPEQLIIATPNGFHPQEGDAWGLGGDHWQKHRSGWTPTDFPGWAISYYDNGTRAGGFVAIK